MSAILKVIAVLLVMLPLVMTNDVMSHEDCVDLGQPPFFVAAGSGKSKEYYYQKSIESASRCCDWGQSALDCKCPISNYWFFKWRIGGWCEKMYKCVHA